MCAGWLQILLIARYSPTAPAMETLGTDVAGDGPVTPALGAMLAVAVETTPG